MFDVWECDVIFEKNFLERFGEHYPHDDVEMSSDNSQSDEVRWPSGTFWRIFALRLAVQLDCLGCVSRVVRSDYSGSLAGALFKVLLFSLH